MWDRAARQCLALGAVAGIFLLDSCRGDGPATGASAQACRLDIDCSGATPSCDPERRVCVECTDNADCAENEICTTANTCRMVTPCVSRTECSLDLVCDQELGFCVDCVGDNDCDDGEICSSESQCRTGCDSDKDCQADGLLCALDDGVCVACVDNVDCERDQYCRAGSCVPDNCDPGHQECSGDDLLTCAASGSGFDSATCAEGCTGEPGNASCIDPPDTSDSSGGSGGSASGGGGSGGSAGNPSASAGGTESSTGGSSSSGGTGGSGGSESSNGGSGGTGSTQCGAPLTIPVTYRDFDAVHPDFAPGYVSDGVTGVVRQRLSADGKPVLFGSSNPDANIESAESFADWYTDGPNSSTIPGELVLYDDEKGGFVNRWGPEGQPWIAYQNVTFCGDPGASCNQCEFGSEQTCLDPCPAWWGTGSCSAVPEELDGNPLFFPIDGEEDLLDDAPQAAKIPPQYGSNDWRWEQDYLGNDAVHNFLFTTEIHIDFAYDASRTQRFSFVGDDDLWVFLNGRLIIDLGGWHEPLSGEFQLDADTAQSYDLVDGEMYEIAVFHAERQPDGSSFLMRLQGFGTTCD